MTIEEFENWIDSIPTPEEVYKTFRAGKEDEDLEEDKLTNKSMWETINNSTLLPIWSSGFIGVMVGWFVGRKHGNRLTLFIIILWLLIGLLAQILISGI